MTQYRERMCAICNAPFRYPIGKGNDRKYCSNPCYNVAKQQHRDCRFTAYPECSVDGCDKPASRVSHGVCETHYYRIRRTGSTDPRPIRGRYVQSAGYILLLDPDHPLANDKGHVYEHRCVLYDTIGDAPHDCHWCAATLQSWNDIVVDHLNEDKTDNRSDNLVATCNTCNRLRGSLLALLDRIPPDKVDELAALAIAYKREHCESGT